MKTKPILTWALFALFAVALAGCGLVKGITETAEKLPEIIDSTKASIASIRAAIEMLKGFIEQIMAIFADLKNSPAADVASTFFGSTGTDAAVGTAAGAGGLWLVIRNILSGKAKKALTDRVGNLEKTNGNGGG